MYSLKEYEQLHQKLFIELYKHYLSGIQVTHGACDPEEVAEELVKEAHLATKKYFEVLKEVSKT